MKKLFSALLFALVAITATASVDNLLPKPQQITVTGGAGLNLLQPVAVTGTALDCGLMQEFITSLSDVQATATQTINVSIVASIAGAYDYELGGFDNEAYRITVTAGQIQVEAVTRTGVNRAAATLLQLAEGTTEIPALTIVDWPAFKLRGFMHDVGRSFITAEELENEIKKLARFKVNCFHWHMTERQAWRFEVKAYPQLTQAEYMTRFAGKYYTQEDCRRIDQLCADYGVVLIPEIDMPGHSNAFQRAMGHSMQTDQGVAELQVILGEAADVFANAPYIHIGADEETITYTNFLQIMINKVHSLDKRCMVWNPISGVNVGSLDVEMCQLWSTSGRKISGKANIDCRYNYTNHFDVFADLAGIYLSQIYYQEKGDAEIAGEISCPWNDRLTPTQEDIIRQNNTWANTIASASRAWIGGGEKYIETGGAVLPNSGSQYEDFLDWETRFLHWKSAWLDDEPIPYVKQSNIRWRLTDYMPNGGNASTTLPPDELGPQDSYTYNGQDYGTRLVTGGGIYLRHTWGGTVPCIFGDAPTGNTAYAWTYVYSDAEQQAGALIEFQNYGRSENDAAPSAGQWDRKGSRVWFNDVELTAPSWLNAGVSINSEVALQDENFTARAPYQLTLQKGWNKIFLKLPYVTSGCRLNKWMWTFVLTDPEGKNALEGIKYSPDKIMDSEAEDLAIFISDIEAKVNSSVSDKIGYYRKESATEILALIAEIKATLEYAMSAAERAAQKLQLSQAYDEFLATYKLGGINLPKASDEDRVYWYSMQTPLRGSYYATQNGASAMVGNTTLSTTGYWKFLNRTDGSYDIVNYNNQYVSPTAATNSQLTLTNSQPAAGWTISVADTEGYVIITSGTVQFNQTNISQKIYNWGGGANTSDTGCKYVIADAPKLPVATVHLSNNEEYTYYYMYTPNRLNRYPTSYGVNADIVGQEAKSESAAWKFVDRGDGTVDIVNFANKTYVSPTALYNTALQTVEERPTDGWTLKYSGGYWFIYCTAGDKAQFNQTTNSTLGYKVYNWFGTDGFPNTSDTGCQYAFVEADLTEPLPNAIDSIEADGASAQTIYTIDGQRVANIRRPGLYIVRKEGRSYKIFNK